jgi:predicted secreted Zn-dependent protease
MSENALYYPYIHIRDVNWLKVTLVRFRQVRRMVPMDGTIEGDDGAIGPFTRGYEGQRPQLDRTNLSSDRAERAQIRLANQLRISAADRSFVKQFGQEAARNEFGQGLGFQIHQGKLHEELRKALGETALAWAPWVKERWDWRLQYVQVHPKIGDAVMSTLAIACATAEGLDIVSDERSRELHKCLLERNQDGVFEAYLGNAPKVEGKPGPDPAPLQATGSEILQFVISVACDPTILDARKLATMGANRQPLNALMEELDKRAARIDPMDPGPRRIERLQDETADVLKAWSQDRRNMDNFWKEFFGLGLAESGKKAAEKIFEATMTGSTGLVLASMLGSVPGLAVGVAFHAASTNFKLARKEEQSPFRYLSLLEKEGVSFEYGKVLAAG